VSVDTARERIMTKLDADFRKHPTLPINPLATFGGKDEVDKRREGMEAALLLRGNPRASGEMVEKGREFAGLTLVDMARECLNAAGVKTRGMDRHEIARVALQGRNGASEYFEGSMGDQLPGEVEGEEPAVYHNGYAHAVTSGSRAYAIMACRRSW
jgi:hypothetical protein